MRLYDLMVNNRRNPLGLDADPFFSWKLASDDTEVFQQTYRILVKESGTEKICWDSGVCKSEQTLYITYTGDGLRPFTSYDVIAEISDNKGNHDTGNTSFETGIMDQMNWKGRWIGSDWKQERVCPVFLRTIVTKNKVEKARAYVTGLGIYDLLIDGEKVGNAFFAPGWTSYHKRIQYQTFDVTEALQGEEHQLELLMAPGWYAGYLNGEGQRFCYGEQMAVRMMLRITYEDGTEETVTTDADWKATESSILESEFYHGEIMDLTKRENVSRDVKVYEEAELGVRQIISQESELVRRKEIVPVKKKWIAPNGDLLLDFGQILPGFVEVALPELQGEELCLEYAETLDKDGNIYRENLRTAKCRDIYRYDKSAVGRRMHPHFTYRGFRYVRVKGVDETVSADAFCAWVLYTDMKQKLDFWCSNPKVQRLWENVMWTQRCNSVDIPTDCPQRDERLGWTGDAAIFCETAIQQFDAVLFYEKYMQDVAAETDDEHGVPHMVPNVVGPATGTAVWSDVATIVPWMVYQYTGDEGILRVQYDNMKRWISYVKRNTGDSVLWTNGFQRGDWLSLDGDMSLMSMSGSTDKDLVANIYYAYSTRILRDAAAVLGKAEDCAQYGKDYDRIVEAINEEYLTKTGRIVSETQTACVLLLYFDIVKDEYKERVFRILTDNLRQHKGHLTTGFVGTAFLCHVLSDNGRHDLAEQLLLNEEYPGWMFEVDHGATTIWERWNSIGSDGSVDATEMNSLCHCVYGTIADWIYRKICGIRPLEAGYKKFTVCPILTKEMPRFKISMETPYGKLEENVICEDGMIRVDLMVPVNTTAKVRLPEQDTMLELGSGEYHFSYETTTDLTKKKWGMCSLLGDILAEEKGKEAFSKVTGGQLDQGMVHFLSGKTLEELAAMMPNGTEVMERLLQEVE